MAPWTVSGTTQVSRYQKGKTNLDLLEQEIVWVSMSALICMPFISHKSIYFQFLLLHTLHGFTLKLFLICLNKHAKSDTSPEIFQRKFLAVCDELSDYHQIDGSKVNNSVAAAAVSREEAKSLRIPASIFTAELVALNFAPDVVWHSRHKKFVIFSDSLSCLLAIQNLQAESEYIMKFLKNCTAMVNTGKTILLCWIPGHVEVMNKTALHSSMSAVKYPSSDLYHDVTALCYKLWQADWDQHIGRKLYSVKPHLGYYPLSSLSRRDAIVL